MDRVIRSSSLVLDLNDNMEESGKAVEGNMFHS